MPTLLPFSERRLTANRANAQLSTSPTTAEGKAKSSLNVVRTGLIGRAILLADEEEVAAYEAHIKRFEQEFQPVGERERTLVQNLADTQWRLDRIANLEAGLFALGRLRCADRLEEEKNPQIRRAMLDTHILVEDAKELKELQAKCKQEQEEQEKQKHSKESVSLKTHAATGGFEFTNSTGHSQELEPNLHASSRTPLTETIR